MNAALLGKKIGMTSFFNEQGEKIPCTVIEAGPCPVVQIKTVETDGYKAVQVGFVSRDVNRTNKPEVGHFNKAGISPTKVLREFRDLAKQLNVGEDLTVQQFVIGDLVNIVGTSKGRGFQGVMKRHHFGGVGMATHGQSDRQRHPGSIGGSSYPSRVFKGTRMAGRMGGKRTTVRNLEIVGIIPESNLLLIKGSVPGAPNSYLEIVKK